MASLTAFPLCALWVVLTEAYSSRYKQVVQSEEALLVEEAKMGDSDSAPASLSEPQSEADQDTVRRRIQDIRRFAEGSLGEGDVDKVCTLVALVKAIAFTPRRPRCAEPSRIFPVSSRRPIYKIICAELCNRAAVRLRDIIQSIMLPAQPTQDSI